MSPKRLGSYLIEAGLLTPAQVEVVLHDQQQTQMRFGEILAARGWVKQKTVDYLMQKIIMPERQATLTAPSPQFSSTPSQPPKPAAVKASRQKLISVNFPDYDIPWVD